MIRNTMSLLLLTEVNLKKLSFRIGWKNLNENDGEKEAGIKLPGAAKNFLIFIATTWTVKGKIQFLVARHGKMTLTMAFLKREIRECILALAFYGFIVDTVAGDGAPENRSAFKLLVTITAKELLEKEFSEEELEGLPLNFKVGFPHPHPMYRDKITIVIGGEMPHWVKKFRNAFDNDSRELSYNGMIMQLNTLYEIWLASGDANVTGGASLRKYKFTHDHFKLDAYLKMRVFLSMQFCSQTMIRMIKDYCNNPNNFTSVSEFQPMIDLFEAVDRLVDIMNGTGFKNGRNRNVELLNHPHHRHIIELFGILRVFASWKKQTKGKENLENSSPGRHTRIWNGWYLEWLHMHVAI